ncbi:MAG: ferritin-like domain-containing protein [Cyclobacteriaceae bacterium]
MKPIESFQDLYLEQLRDRYDAAKQQAETYPKLEQAASDPTLKSIIQDDIASNQSHLDKLAQLFDKMGEQPEGEQCEGTQGLIHEADELLSYTSSGNVQDAGIAMSIQHINHHDIAGYNSCVMYANANHDTETAAVLQQMLDEEMATDESLKKLIAQIIPEPATS